MKRYEFRMNKVLRVRRLQEDAAKAAVAEARAAQDTAAQAVTASRQHYAELTRPQAAQDARQFLSHRTRADWRSGAVRHAVARHDMAADTTSAAIDGWQSANRRVSALERLDERRRDEYAVLARRDDDAAVDEMVTARARRTA